jgi:hypothetical protein
MHVRTLKRPVSQSAKANVEKQERGAGSREVDEVRNEKEKVKSAARSGSRKKHQRRCVCFVAGVAE